MARVAPLSGAYSPWFEFHSFIVVNDRGPFSLADLAALDFIGAKRLRPWILERPPQGIYPCLRLGLRLLPRWRCEGFRSHHAFYLCHAPSPVATGSATSESGVRSMTSPLLACPRLVKKPTTRQASRPSSAFGACSLLATRVPALFRSLGASPCYGASGLHLEPTRPLRFLRSAWLLPPGKQDL
jgi:hypothetical protein